VSLWKERETGSSLGLFRDFETVQGEKLLEKFPMLKRESGDLFPFHLTRMLPPSQANISPLTANKFSTTRGEELPPSSGANKGTSQGTIAWDFFCHPSHSLRYFSSETSVRNNGKLTGKGQTMASGSGGGG
jgi:hypothetical protein